MISAAPDTMMTLMSLPMESKYLLVILGNDVAILLPSGMSSMDLTGDASGTATARRQYPNWRLRTFLRS